MIEPPPPPKVEPAPKPKVAEVRKQVQNTAMLKALDAKPQASALRDLANDDAPPLDLGKLGGGDLALPSAGGGGSRLGRVGGTGNTPGAGVAGPATGNARPASIASIKSMPQPIGDYDYSRDYPDEARKLEIEGDVVVRLLIDATGNVSETKLVKGLGHGLDEKARELAKKLRFKPARDSDDNPVSTWIAYTFHFTLPR